MQFALIQLDKVMRWVRCFLCSVAGGMALTVGVGSPVLLGAVGMATDYAMYTSKQADLQMAVDAAAIAAARELSLTNYSAQSVTSVAESFVNSALVGNSDNLQTEVSFSDKEGSVTVTTKDYWTPMLGHFIGIDITPVLASATAKLVGGSKICVLALDGKGGKAIHLDKTASVVAVGCGVYSNSASVDGIRLDQDATISSDLICSSGGIVAKARALSTPPLTDCPPVPDPLAGRPTPAVGSCDYVNTTLLNGSHTLYPGVYCGGILIKKTASVTFAPGDYIIKDGNFEVSDKAFASGEHVSFYLGKKSYVRLLDEATVTFSGSKTGPMAGLLFFSDRSASDSSKHLFNSCNVKELTGTLYFPSGRILIDPNASVAEESAYTAIVAFSIELNEGPKLVLNTNYSDTDVPVPEGLHSGASVVLTY